MKSKSYVPVYELTRGSIVESIHWGAAAIVTAAGKLLAWIGDPHTITYLRSSSKPFQALPFVEQKGPEAFHLAEHEIALLCASHTGTSVHVATARSIQAKANFQESDLKCGSHYPGDDDTYRQMLTQGETPTANHHNCSGKHSGMLAFARLNGWDLADYLENSHPVQQRILKAIAEMTDLHENEIIIGIDGCSAPNFALPLVNAALGFARLADPVNLPSERAAALDTIFRAMTTHPSMISGPNRFDTLLMETMSGRVVSKGGAEGYQGIGIKPGALERNPFGIGPSPALGIAIKIADGDAREKARSAVALEILRQLGAISTSELQVLEKFGPVSPINNWQNLIVGEARPCFELQSGLS